MNKKKDQGFEGNTQPKIKIVGVGGAGCNAVNNMIRSELEGAAFVISNTDGQSLNQSLCYERIQLGSNITKGLGAGAEPEIGKLAAEEALDDIIAHISDSDMLFITAGMGGGTGTGAAPIIAKCAKDLGILTVGVVTKPFDFEGKKRQEIAEKGVKELGKFVDTLIVVPNQNLFKIASQSTTFSDAFKMADNVLFSGVKGITDLIIMPGLINLDFADVKSIMREMGKAMMGTGEAEGETRAIDAAESAIMNPLLDNVSMKGAKGVLLNITGGSDMTLYEIDEAVNRVRSEVDEETNIIFGSTFDDSIQGGIRISIVATGIDVPNVLTSKEIKTEDMEGLIEVKDQDLDSVPQNFIEQNETALKNEKDNHENNRESKEESLLVENKKKGAKVFFSRFWKKQSKNKNPVIISDNDSLYEQDQDIDLPTFLRNQKNRGG